MQALSVCRTGQFWAGMLPAGGRMNSERRFLTTYEASQLLGVSLPTIINWIKAGRLSAHRTPGGHRRIDRDALVSLIRRHELPMPPELMEERALPRVLILASSRAEPAKAVSLVRAAGFEARAALGELSIGFELGRSAPDALLLDLDSLGSRAFSILPALAAAQGYQPPPAFGIGAASDEKTMKKAAEGGLTALFLPDVEPAAFRQRIERALRKV